MTEDLYEPDESWCGCLGDLSCAEGASLRREAAAAYRVVKAHGRRVDLIAFEAAWSLVKSHHARAHGEPVTEEKGYL